MIVLVLGGSDTHPRQLGPASRLRGKGAERLAQWTADSEYLGFLDGWGER